MVILTSMTIIELATGVVAVCGAIGAVIHNSRCSKISCCGINCERDVIKQETTNDDDFSRAVENPNLKSEDKV